MSVSLKTALTTLFIRPSLTFQLLITGEFTLVVFLTKYLKHDIYTSNAFTLSCFWQCATDCRVLFARNNNYVVPTSLPFNNDSCNCSQRAVIAILVLLRTLAYRMISFFASVQTNPVTTKPLVFTCETGDDPWVLAMSLCFPAWVESANSTHTAWAERANSTHTAWVQRANSTHTATRMEC